MGSRSSGHVSGDISSGGTSPGGLISGGSHYRGPEAGDVTLGGFDFDRSMFGGGGAHLNAHIFTQEELEHYEQRYEEQYVIDPLCYILRMYHPEAVPKEGMLSELSSSGNDALSVAAFFSSVPPITPRSLPSEKMSTNFGTNLGESTSTSENIPARRMGQSLILRHLCL